MALRLNEDTVIGLAEAAKLLGVSYTTAKRLAAKGKFPGQLPKLGSRYGVSRVALDDYLAHAVYVEDDADGG